LHLPDTQFVDPATKFESPFIVLAIPVTQFVSPSTVLTHPLIILLSPDPVFPIPEIKFPSPIKFDEVETTGEDSEAEDDVVGVG